MEIKKNSIAKTMGKMELYYIACEYVKQWALLERLEDFPNVKHRVNIGYDPISPSLAI